MAYIYIYMYYYPVKITRPSFKDIVLLSFQTIHISRPMIKSFILWFIYLYTYINTWSKTLDFILGIVLLPSRPYYINGPILTRSDIYFNLYILQKSDMLIKHLIYTPFNECIRTLLLFFFYN